MKLGGAAVVVLGCCATQALAQKVLPSRDVAVTYQIEGPATGLVPGGNSGTVRLSWDAHGRRVRIEQNGRSQVVLIDLSRHTGEIVNPVLQMALPLTFRASDLQPLTLENARLSSPRGQARVAGLTCTVYGIVSGSGGTICLTDDGVPLRGAGTIQGRAGRFEATSVQYGRVPLALFEPPPGYISVDAGRSGAQALRSFAGRLGLGLPGQVAK